MADRIVLDGELSLNVLLDGTMGIMSLIEVGIAQIIFNPDYTITFVMTDGRRFTTGSIRGAVGEKGDKGDTGERGEKGEQGERGLQGETGAQGIQGEKGDTGNTGPQGPKGDKGDTGNTGPVGPKGDKGDDYILTAQDKSDIAGLVDVPVDDVQVNGTSVVEYGIANIPIASSTKKGVVGVDATNGIKLTGSNNLIINPPSANQIKNGSNSTYPIVPSKQHESVFYGLAKAAGDATQSESSNAVGNYTNGAKTAIRAMLGIDTASLVAEIKDALNL